MNLAEDLEAGNQVRRIPGDSASRLRRDGKRLYLQLMQRIREKIALRSAMVMSAQRGGTFDLLLRLVRFGLGGTSGTGKQYISWVHEEDFVRAIEYLMEREELEGPINVASPNPLPNEEFMSILRKAWGATIGLPASERMLEVGAFFLRTETELILKSRRVVPGLLLTSGFAFRFAEWRTAAEELVRRWRGQRHEARNRENKR